MTNARRGMTFLEVVLSTVLLSLVTAMILSAINGIVTSQIRQNQRLAAAEVANRLMLQYIDDQDSMPSKGLPVVYGRDRYRWEIGEKPITLTPAKTDPTNARANASSLNLNRLKTVQIDVWLSEESGGSGVPEPGVPHFALARIVDPVFGQLRNPDTADHIMKDPVLRQRFLDAVTSLASNTGARPTGVTPRSATGSGPKAGSGGTPGTSQPGQPQSKFGNSKPSATGGGKQ